MMSCQRWNTAGLAFRRRVRVCLPVVELASLETLPYSRDSEKAAKWFYLVLTPIYDREVSQLQFYGKRSFSVTTPCDLRVDTERLAEREKLLHRLGSKLNRIV